MALTLAPVAPPLRIDEHGVIRAIGSRVQLEMLIVGHTYHGYGAPELHDAWPSVSLADCYAILGYYYANKDEVDAYVAERTRVADELRAQIEAEFPPRITRAELQRRVRERDATGTD